MKKTHFFCLQKYMGSVFLVITKRTFFWTIETLTSLNYDPASIIMHELQHYQYVIKKMTKKCTVNLNNGFLI